MNHRDMQQSGPASAISEQPSVRNEGQARVEMRSEPAAAPDAVSQAERAVMHPETHDTEWRYYHGALHS